MKRVGCALALALPLVGCRTEPATRPAAPATPDGTRYRAGDWVVYGYTGRAIAPAPVVVRERVVCQRGRSLAIDVTIERGAERRHFVQVVTDTKENEVNDVVDELWTFDGGAKTRLANAGNADLARLYAWTTVSPDGRAFDVTTAPAEVAFGGATHRCARTQGKNTLGGRPIRFEANDCEDFSWTHGPARFYDAETGEDVLRVDVVEAGRDRVVPAHDAFVVPPGRPTCSLE